VFAVVKTAIHLCCLCVFISEWSCSDCRARNSSWWGSWSGDVPESYRAGVLQRRYIWAALSYQALSQAIEALSTSRSLW